MNSNFDTTLFILNQYNIPKTLINNPTFVTFYTNWYFCNHHNWEWVPEEPIESVDYDSDFDSEIEWYISDGTTIPFKEDNKQIVDLFEDGYISDTGSDYSLYWYNSD